MIAPAIQDTNNLRGDRIRVVREQLGLSQRELARRCGFAPNQISRYESEAVDPSATHLKIIAEKLGVSVDYLLGLAVDPLGQANDSDLTEVERDLLDIFRREGWAGVIRLGADRMARPS